jgi:hypothetical protein
MAVRKIKQPETDEQRRIRDRADRARRATPPRDPTGAMHVAGAEIATAAHVDAGDVLDDLDHEAAVIEYEGGRSRAEAEALAIVHVRERYTRQKEIG